MSGGKSEKGGSCRRAWELLATIEGELDAISAMAVAQLRDEYGPAVLRYARDTAAAIQACGSPDLRTRTAALMVLCETGGVGPGLPERVLDILRSDDPLDLKRIACAVLHMCAAHRVPFPYLPSLLPLLLDEQTEADLRVGLYNAARFICHVLEFARRGVTPESVILPTAISSAEEIDWQWVHSAWADLGQSPGDP